MKKLTLAIAILFLCQIVYGQVIITEVYYDPEGSEAGGEFVELFNAGDRIVDISQWTLRTKSNEADVTIPKGTVIMPQSYFLIADSGWSEKKDNSKWVGADLEDAMTMVNSDAGVALKNNGIVDAVGWGNIEGLFEGNSTQAPEGFSLQRKKINGSFIDTQNNFNDFEILVPNPKNSSSGIYQEGTLDLEITVVDTSINFLFVNLTDDNKNEEGIQISPLPGGKRKVDVRVGLETSQEIKNVSLLFMNGSSLLVENESVYVGSFSLDYDYTPGRYSFSIEANSGDNKEGYNGSFSLLSMAGLEIDTQSLVIDTIKPGKEVKIEGDSDIKTKESPTLKNIGNTPLDIAIHSTPLFSLDSVISLENLFFSLDGVDYHKIGLEGIRKEVNLGLNGFQPLSFKFIIPTNASAGTYKSSISINALSR